MDTQKLADETMQKLNDMARANGPALPVEEELFSLIVRRLVKLERTAGLPTTAEPQTTVPTREARSAAAAPASTDQPTRPLSQWGQYGTHAGPVEQPSGCAHEWMDWFAMVDGSRVELTAGKSETVWCRCCGALKLYGKIVAPVATPASSTSQSPASPSSAALSSEEPAPSASSASSKWWCPKCLHFCERVAQTRGKSLECNTCGAVVTIDTAADEVTR